MQALTTPLQVLPSTAASLQGRSVGLESCNGQSFGSLQSINSQADKVVNISLRVSMS